ncbi:FUSC family protein [Streptomyces sp. NPDC021093]|uniref:FUSC family protein n=1 Tax=Streptomyces sp. NPDC021093 TaxID=3365112 RepID=UPI0037915E52
MSWLKSLKDTARSGLTVERQRLDPLVAVRAAVGLALVVGAALYLFGPAVAASSAFGAFQAALATFQRSWRTRPVLALASGASLAVTTFVGYLTGAHPVLFISLLALWTFLAGMAWAVGPTAGMIASSNVAIMLVTVTLPTSVAAAAGHAGMIMFGGVVQAALIVLFPVRRWGAQRDALADALAAEADYARRLRHDPVAPFDPEPLMTARHAAAITPRQARRRPAELHGTRGLAERIRPVLASLADPALGVPAEGEERARVRELLAAAGSTLDAAARAVRKGEPVTMSPAARAVLAVPKEGAVLTGPARRAESRLITLLRDVIETAQGSGTTNSRRTGPDRSPRSDPGRGPDRGPESVRSLKEETAHRTATRLARNAARRVARRPEHRADPDDHLHRPTVLELVPVALRLMRGELRRDSPVLRHAVRVSAVSATGYAVASLLPLGHSYWAPMAAVMIMRPDFSQTYSRAVARFGGTLLGVALATGLVQLTHPDTRLSAGLAVGCAFLMFLLLRTGYAVTQVFVAAYVVFLLGMGGLQWTQTVPERVVLTLAGGLLAMLAYAVYPAWETPRLRTRLADWLIADGRYASAVLQRYADPAGAPREAVRETLLGTREARVAWKDALERAANEPVRHRGLSRAAAADAPDALAQLARVAMLMEAHLPARDTTPVPAAATLADALHRDVTDAARAVRERRAPKWDTFRAALDAWDAEDTTGDDKVVRKGAGLLLEALDELTEALAGEGPRPKGNAAAVTS